MTVKKFSPLNRNCQKTLFEWSDAFLNVVETAASERHGFAANMRS